MNAMTLAARRAYQEDEREALRELDPEFAEHLEGEFPCQGCGCSDSLGCEDGCAWATALLCTACANDGVVIVAVDREMGRWLTAALADVDDDDFRAVWVRALTAIATVTGERDEARARASAT
jgi:hypothetical protein